MPEEPPPPTSAQQGEPLTGQTPPRRVHVIRDGLAAHLPDIDPEETAEWLDSFDAVLDLSLIHI